MEAKLFRELILEFSEEGLFKINDTFGYLLLFIEALIFATILFLLVKVEIGGFFYWLLEGLAGLSLFRWFAILHECGHKTLFTRSWMNSVVGHVASAFCLIPYFPWRNIHLLHHRWVGVIDKDPTQKDLLKLREMGNTKKFLFRIVWKLWIPIPFAQFLFQVFWGYPIICARNGDYRNARLGWWSLIFCLGIHILLIAWIGLYIWIIYFLPMLIFFYVMIENMNLPQHSELFPYLSDTHPNPIPHCHQDNITRSTHLPNWLSILFALNFNRHTEHHLFTAAPWYRLNTIRDRLHSCGYHYPHEVPFLRFMKGLRRRDPLNVYRDSLPHFKERKP